MLVLASGNLTHNLGDMQRGAPAGAPPAAWAVAFDDWVAERVASGDLEELARYRTLAPHAERAHPRDEHFMPLLVAAGAGGERATGRRLHRHFIHGSLSMAAYAFGDTEPGA